MVASSPAPISNTSDSSLITAAVPSGSQPKTVRRVNKPKCIPCGNLARSRCPYQSCKSCCSKAQNPCQIHVLKENATTPTKVPSALMISFDRQSAELSPAVFAQLNNVQTPHSRKPPIIKEAVAINEWRFSKLIEYMERTLEKQNKAYDRYMQNIRLLEEAFSMKLMQGSSSEEVPNTYSENAAAKKRKQRIVDEWLRKLEEWELSRDRKRPEKVKTWSNQRASRRLRDDESVAQTTKSEADSRKGMDFYSPKLVRTVEISDQGIVSRVNAHFTSLAKIARK